MLVVTQHKDVFIIGFHEITLASNLCHSIRISLYIFQRFTIMAVLFLIFSYFRLQILNLIGIFYPLHEAVLIKYTHNKDTEYNNNVEFEPAEEIENMSCNFTHANDC